MHESLLAEAYSCLTVQARANETKYTGVSSADAKGSFGKSAFGSIGQHITIINLPTIWLRLTSCDIHAASRAPLLTPHSSP